MMRRIVVALALTLAATPLAAQGSGLITPDAPLSPARAKLRDALVAFRDSLGAIDAAAARLQRDYQQASAAALESRAHVVELSCAAAGRTLSAARNAVKASDAARASQISSRDALLKQLDKLSPPLGRCQTEFAALSARGKGDEVRDYANRRIEPTIQAIRAYEPVVQRFVAAMGFSIQVRSRQQPVLAG